MYAFALCFALTRRPTIAGGAPNVHNDVHLLQGQLQRQLLNFGAPKPTPAPKKHQLPAPTTASPTELCFGSGCDTPAPIPGGPITPFLADGTFQCPSGSVAILGEKECKSLINKTGFKNWNVMSPPKKDYAPGCSATPDGTLYYNPSFASFAAKNQHAGYPQVCKLDHFIAVAATVQYVSGGAYKFVCPSGSEIISDETECESLKGKQEFTKWKGAADYPEHPTGCFSNGRSDLYFNTKQTPKSTARWPEANKKYPTICKVVGLTARKLDWTHRRQPLTHRLDPATSVTKSPTFAPRTASPTLPKFGSSENSSASQASTLDPATSVTKSPTFAPRTASPTLPKFGSSENSPASQASTLDPATSVTKSPTFAPRTANPAAQYPAAQATGDPHLRNINGQRFDLMRPGKHALIHIPRSAAPEQTLFDVTGEAQALGALCADVYFQELNITGAWVDEKQHGGFQFQAGDVPCSQGFGKQIHIKSLILKVAYGCTLQGARYLNFYVRNLGNVAMPVGGLLGEDDHAAEEVAAQECGHHVALRVRNSAN